MTTIHQLKRKRPPLKYRWQAFVHRARMWVMRRTQPPPDPVVWLSGCCDIMISAGDICNPAWIVSFVPLGFGNPDCKLEVRSYGPFGPYEAYGVNLVEKCAWAYMMEFQNEVFWPDNG